MHFEQLNPRLSCPQTPALQASVLTSYADAYCVSLLKYRT